MGSVVLCILRSRLIIYSAGSGMNRVQVVLSVFSMWNASFKLTMSGCVIYICSVGFASLDVVCDELNDCAWNVCL